MAGIPPNQANAFLDNFKPTFSKFLFAYQASFPYMPRQMEYQLREELLKLQRALQEHTLELIMERIFFEMERWDWSQIR